MSMTLREAGYRWEMPAGSVLPFEERILASGLCDFALDMTFSTYRGVKRARYDCGGYVAVGEMDLTSPDRALEVLEKTLLAMGKAGEFFLDRDKILLNGETVFYNEESGDIRIAYYPREKALPVTENMVAFAEDLERMSGDVGRRYLARLRELFLRHNSGLRDMQRATCELRREIFQQTRAEQEKVDGEKGGEGS